ncbi:hypothetical protein BSKO_08103 [Bryopsis sp. KO-2023]|nr:hypothetical protein BSKO_08103 [Bryopsis sp. KO-2023]
MDMEVHLPDFHEDIQQFWSQLRSEELAKECDTARTAEQQSLREMAEVEARLTKERSKKQAKLSEHQLQIKNIGRESAHAADDKKRKLEHIRAIAAEEEEIKEGLASVSKRMKVVSEKENDAKKMKCTLGLQHHFTNIKFHSSSSDCVEGNVSDRDNRNPKLFRIPSRSHTVAAADKLWDLVGK